MCEQKIKHQKHRALCSLLSTVYCTVFWASGHYTFTLYGGPSLWMFSNVINVWGSITYLALSQIMYSAIFLITILNIYPVYFLRMLTVVYEMSQEVLISRFSLCMISDMVLNSSHTGNTRAAGGGQCHCDCHCGAWISLSSLFFNLFVLEFGLKEWLSIERNNIS